MAETSSILSAPPPRLLACAEVLPFISVIVPVRNEAAHIGRTLEQLLNQDYDPDRFEIIVADGRSTDGTRGVIRELQKRHDKLVLVDNPKRWSSAGRNAAIRSARGDLIVLIDGHCEIDNANYLLELASAFVRSGTDCVGRPQPMDVPGASVLQRAIAVARSSWLGHNPRSYIYSAAEQFVEPQSVAIAYRREVFERLGLFDEEFDACEDVEFNHRVAGAGLRCFFTPAVQVRYHPRTTLPGLFRQMARYGRGRVRLLHKHPETFGLSCFLPAALLLGLLVGPAVAWMSGWLALGYGSFVGLYTALLVAVSLAVSVRAGEIRLFPRLLLVYAAIHLGAGAGVLLEALTGAKRRRVFPQRPALAAQLERRAA